MSKSVFDLLLAHGYPAPPETVIIRVDGITDGVLRTVLNRDHETFEIAPLFDEMVLELDMTSFTKHEWQDHIVETRWCIRVSLFSCDDERNRNYVIAIYEYDVIDEQRVWTIYPNAIGFQLDRYGVLQTASEQPAIQLSRSHIGFEIAWCAQMKMVRPITMSDEEAQEISKFCLYFLAYLSDGIEAEIVMPSRQVRRSFHRRYGKNPSPVVVVRLDHHARKIYAPSGMHTGSKKARHAVRGHFRRVIDHPFIPAGIYYIHSHMRGGSAQEQAIGPKQYRIVLK